MKTNNFVSGVIAVAIAGLTPIQAAEPPTNEKPTAYMVADAHLDTQWNWDIQTTISTYVWNTLNQNLYLFEKYPGYVFNFEGGVKYAWMKEYYPREYELMKKYIDNGRWHLSGASWEASDVIVPSVESSIRNILLGQTFYRDEFGTESTDIFLPDCFGFGWTLPTIASHCGLIGFSSQKLQWRVNPFYGDMKYPFTVGLWQGIDGSKIMMAHGYNYTTRWPDEDLTLNETLGRRIAENPLNVVYHYYGTGDIGGSPTITSVKAVEDALSADGPIKIISATSDRLYKEYLPFADHPELPVFDGELTMDVHGTGCYTSQAAMKLYNRQNERLGDAAERAAMSAELLGTATYPSKALTEVWRRVLFHQFHDDLTGTSIPRAYEFSWNDELLSLKQFAAILENSAAAVASKLDTRVKGTPVVLYNPLGHEVTDVVEITLPTANRPAKADVFDAYGQKLNAQITGRTDGAVTLIVEATVPANGFTVADVRLSGKGNPATSKEVSSIENSRYCMTFDGNGDITSLKVKNTNRELVEPGRAIRLAMFEENESFQWPAWEILKETIDREPVSITENVHIELLEDGPLRHTIRVSKKHGESKFVQYIRLYEGALADRIDFYNEIDWASTNALLKAEFPLTIQNATATYDLGLGSINRGNNVPTAYEVYSQRWADLTDYSGNYGMTVMNECKYGWDKPADNVMRLTLLHTPKTKGRYIYQDHQDFGHHTFTYSLLPHEGKLDLATIDRQADAMGQRVKAFVTAKHSGQIGRSFSLAASDNPNIAIKAMKKAESSDEYVIRIYETSGQGSQKASITFPFAIAGAVEADGTEKTTGAATYSGNTLTAEVGKNSIATYKVTFEHTDSEPTTVYAELPLTYDTKCFSWNGFESDVDFSDGYSYAAELLPATLEVAGVPFSIENKELLNGKKCAGDTLRIPEGQYNKLYILAAAASESDAVNGTLKVGKTEKKISVSSYTGFIGQWGHLGHTTGYIADDEVAYVGTHRHSPDGDNPYEFTYMFKYEVDVPRGASEIVLPNNPQIVVFAATLAEDNNPMFASASPLFRTSIATTEND